MSHISPQNGTSRVLQPDIPPPSINPEYQLAPLPAPLDLAPPDSMEHNGNPPKGFWPFRRGNQHRSGQRNFVPPKRGAPLLERSLSEPNSPTEPNNTATESKDRVDEKPNYISTARDLLYDSKVRFDGHEKEWSAFRDRYHQ